ncbi:hypothetical protein KQX54_005622 [Cotesia glomerata]|uniref:Uncharacterized protein n=1 Tax=Cotesia glomerata TaxID=32391 RepID=A0AAV7I738_COTGL|nr:hypothetical protein KQX54_005622 [Cotesia glomerata]
MEPSRARMRCEESSCMVIHFTYSFGCLKFSSRSYLEVGSLVLQVKEEEGREGARLILSLRGRFPGRISIRVCAARQGFFWWFECWEYEICRLGEYVGLSREVYLIGRVSGELADGRHEPGGANGDETETKDRLVSFGYASRCPAVVCTPASRNPPFISFIIPSV